MAGWQFEAPQAHDHRRGIAFTAPDLRPTAPGEYEARDLWFFHDAPLDRAEPCRALRLPSLQCTAARKSARFIRLRRRTYSNARAPSASPVLCVPLRRGAYECRPAASSSVSASGHHGSGSTTHTLRGSHARRQARLRIRGRWSTANGPSASQLTILGAGSHRSAFIVDGQTMDDVTSAAGPQAPAVDRIVACVPCPLVARPHAGVRHDAHRERGAHGAGGVDRCRRKPHGVVSGQRRSQEPRSAERGRRESVREARRLAGESRAPRGEPRASSRMGARGRSPAGCRPRDGAPIVGAALDVSATTGRPGSRAKVIGQVVTDGNGAFNFSPKAGSSRRITVSYRAYTLDSAASAMSDVVATNPCRRAAHRLAQARQPARSHQIHRTTARRARPRGHAGGHLRAGRIVGRGFPLRTVRADSRGRFRYRYRFSNSAPGTTYRFQATLHAQRSYPYATGHSRTVAVRIK